MVDYNIIQKMIIAELQSELIGQGHDASGSLVNSIEGDTMVLPNSVVVNILMNDYGQYVNSGRKAGGKKVPLSVLMQWVEKRGIANGNKEIKNVAFAIQQKIHQEGSPTNASFKFSKNGRRTGFVDFVVENRLDPILNELSETIFKEFDLAADKIVQSFNKINL